MQTPREIRGVDPHGASGVTLITPAQNPERLIMVQSGWDATQGPLSGAGPGARTDTAGKRG